MCLNIPPVSLNLVCDSNSIFYAYLLALELMSKKWPQIIICMLNLCINYACLVWLAVVSGVHILGEVLSTQKFSKL